MSGSKRCCCGNPEGCLRCTTPTSFLGTPPLWNWCGVMNLSYEFTFGVGELLLPEIKSNTTLTDFLHAVEPPPSDPSGCDCDPDIIPELGPISRGITLIYDTNILRDNNGNIIDANSIGCTYNNQDIFTYDPEFRDALAEVNKIGMHPGNCPTTYTDPHTGQVFDCGTSFIWRDLEAFIAPAYGITQHNNAAFSCQFRACGNSSIPAFGPAQTCDLYDSIPDTNCSNTIQSFSGATFIEADPYVLKLIRYFPVVRTINKITPPTPDCFYSIEEQSIPGSIDRPTPVIKTCYVPSEEEECRCQSGLIVEITGRAEQQNLVIVYEEEQIVGPGGELIGNRNFIAVGTTMSTQSNTNNWQPAMPKGQCKIRLYYFGCIDDIIYGISSPAERVFTLDAGAFIYDGVYSCCPHGGHAGPHDNVTNINLESLPPVESCPNRPVNCIASHFQSTAPRTIVQPASFFLGLGLPNEIVVKRL